MKQFLSIFVGSAALIGGVSAAEEPLPAPTAITTLSGRSFQGVKILKATPDGLAFRHSRGAAQIPFADLPEALQKQFQYNPEAAKAYVKEHVEAERLAAEKAAQARAERRKKQDEVKLAKLQLALLREQSAAAGSGFGAGGYTDWGVPTWGYGLGADWGGLPQWGQGAVWDGRRWCFPRGGPSATDILFHNYNTTKYIGPFSALYSGALTNSNVRPLLTFGGYRYPTAIASVANVPGSRFTGHRANMRPGGVGHVRSGGRPAFVPPNSAGARIGGTGGLMRVGSPRISHQ